MEPTIHDLLEAADDPDCAEFPPCYDGEALNRRVVALKPELERIAGRSFVLDCCVQDASFFTDLSIQVAGLNPGYIDTVFAVRFSNFGDLFTTWNHGPEQLTKVLAAELVAAVEVAGFRFVPQEALGQAYTGRHTGFRKMAASSRVTWKTRFFDYL